MFKYFSRKILSWWHHFRVMWSSFYRDGGPMMAAAISFYFMLSAVPLTLLSLSIVGMILGSPERAASLIISLTNMQLFLPDGTMHIGSFFRTFVRHASTVSKLSFLLLFIFSGGVFLTVESAINRVFERRENRPLWRQLLFAYILMFLTYLALIGSAGATWSAILISDFGISVLGLSAQSYGHFWRWFFLLAPVLWVSMYFGLIYKFIPHRKVPWKYAILGGLFAGIGWEVAKRLFTLYIRYVVRLSELYGGISAVLATFMWIFYTAAILLLGGELTMSFIRSNCEKISKKSAENALKRM